MGNSSVSFISLDQPVVFTFHTRDDLVQTCPVCFQKNFTSDPDTLAHAHVDLSVSLQAGMFRGLQASRLPVLFVLTMPRHTHCLNVHHFSLEFYDSTDAILKPVSSKTIAGLSAEGKQLAGCICSPGSIGTNVLAFHMQLPPGHSPDCSGG